MILDLLALTEMPNELWRAWNLDERAKTDFGLTAADTYGGFGLNKLYWLEKEHDDL